MLYSEGSLHDVWTTPKDLRIYPHNCGILQQQLDLSVLTGRPEPGWTVVEPLWFVTGWDAILQQTHSSCSLSKKKSQLQAGWCLDVTTLQNNGIQSRHSRARVRSSIKRECNTTSGVLLIVCVFITHYKSHRFLISWAIVMNACSTLVALFALVSRNLIPSSSA